MTPYELADAIEDWDSDGQWDTPAANMIRQQADKLTKYELRHAEQRKRIDELEKQNSAMANALLGFGMTSVTWIGE